MTRTKEDILKQIDEAGVRYIRLCFTDILGKIKDSLPQKPLYDTF